MYPAWQHVLPVCCLSGLCLLCWQTAKSMYDQYNYVPVIQPIVTDQYIECNMTRAQHFNTLNPLILHQANTSQAQHFRRNVRHLLVQAKTALMALGIPFWISSGTLLGWYRQCDVISYSGDADIGVFAHLGVQHTDNIIQTFEQHGLMLHMILGQASDSYQLAFFGKQIKLDIYFFYVDQDQPNVYWNAATKPETGEQYRYEFSAFSLCHSHLLSVAVLVPCATELYLTENYGADLMVPVQEWDWRLSPPNARYHRLCTHPDCVQIFHQLP